MASITFGRFKRILRALNADLRVFEARSTRSSLIYLANGHHPLCDPVTGLREICGYPSPVYFHSFQKYDFIDHTERLQRGYTTVFKILCLKGLIKKDALRKLLPGALDPHHYRPEVKPHEDPEARNFVPIHALAARNTGIKIRRVARAR